MSKRSLKYRNGKLNKRYYGLNGLDHATNNSLLEFFGKISIINPLQDRAPQEFKQVDFRRRNYGGKQSKKM